MKEIQNAVHEKEDVFDKIEKIIKKEVIEHEEVDLEKVKNSPTGDTKGKALKNIY